MVPEKRNSIPGEVYGQFLMKLHTNSMVRELQTPAIAPEDQTLTSQLLSRRRTKFATAALFTVAQREFTPEEQVGMIYTIQAINTADDAIDNGNFGKQGLSEDILSGYPVEDTGVTLGELRTKIADNLGGEQQGYVDTYIQDMIRVHNESPRFTPGEFTFEEAYQYREATTGGFAQLGADLAELSPRRAKLVRKVGMGLQWIDDAEDVRSDMEPDAIGNGNMFVGMATDECEFPKLEVAAAIPHLSPREIISSTPRTRNSYRKGFKAELSGIEKRGPRAAVLIVGLKKRVP